MGSSEAVPRSAARPGPRRGRRVGRVLVALTLTAVVAAGAAEALAWGRQQTLAGVAGRLETRWQRDEARGVASGRLAPLRLELARTVGRSRAWWSPLTWGAPANPNLGRLRHETAAIYRSEVTRARQRAAVALAAWHQTIRRDGHWVPARLVAQGADWPLALARARTPALAASLAVNWSEALQAARGAAARARSQAVARANSRTGAGGLVSTAAGLIAIARADNLDPAPVPRLAGQLRSELLHGEAANVTAAQLSQAILRLRALIGLNGQVAAAAAAAAGPVDQAAAEQVRGASRLLATYRADQAAFTAAATAAALTRVNARLGQLRTSAETALAGDRCGHPVPSGKVITIALSLQEMVFYDNGCEVQATPITTGRPLLRTPTGTFHIFDKQTPYVFVSPWPPGSPFWYPTSPVNWVMEFDQGGYYIHDAPWEPPSAFGVDSENGVWASHGCVHTPTSVMRWAFGWTPMGAPVIVSA